LGGHSPDTPKCLLEVARRPLIEHQLGACADAGVAPVAVVVGYCGDEIKQVVGLRAEYISNPRWATTNSIYSFLLARDWVTGPLIVMNCDVLFDPEVLTRLVAAGQDSIAYDSSSGRGAEQMKIKLDDEHVVAMSKTLPVEESAGENLGILYFGADTARALVEKASEIVAAGGENLWFPAAVSEIARTRRLKAVDMAGLSWAEIDNAWDLDHARKKVWPAIERARGRKRRRRTFRWALPVPLALVASTAFWGLSRPAPVTPAPPVFETVFLEGASALQIKHRGRSQTWWLLENDGKAAATVDGPAPVRIDSRFVLRDRAREMPYVVRLEVDGKLVDLHKNYARHDSEAQHEGWSIGRRKDEELSLLPGTHSIAVKLVGADPGDRCLVRIRTTDTESGAEPPDQSRREANATLGADSSR
jgi:choline kinase